MNQRIKAERSGEEVTSCFIELKSRLHCSTLSVFCSVLKAQKSRPSSRIGSFNLFQFSCVTAISFNIFKIQWCSLLKRARIFQAVGYRLAHRDSNPTRHHLYLRHNVQTGSGAHPSSYPTRTRFLPRKYSGQNVKLTTPPLSRYLHSPRHLHGMVLGCAPGTTLPHHSKIGKISALVL